MKDEPRAQGAFTDFTVRIIEATAGFDLACILTLLFLIPLALSQIIASCLFIISFTALLSLRMEIWLLDGNAEVLSSKQTQQFSDYLNAWWTWATMATYVGFSFMLWKMSPIVTMVFAVSSVGSYFLHGRTLALIQRKEEPNKAESPSIPADDAK